MPHLLSERQRIPRVPVPMHRRTAAFWADVKLEEQMSAEGKQVYKRSVSITACLRSPLKCEEFITSLVLF